MSASKHVDAPELNITSENPFSNRATVQYSLDAPCRVELIVYSAQGQKIASIVRGTQAAGEHRAEWDGRTEEGQEASSGAYFILSFVNGKKIGEVKAVKAR